MELSRLTRNDSNVYEGGGVESETVLLESIYIVCGSSLPLLVFVESSAGVFHSLPIGISMAISMGDVAGMKGPNVMFPPETQYGRSN